MCYLERGERPLVRKADTTLLQESYMRFLTISLAIAVAMALPACTSKSSSTTSTTSSESNAAATSAAPAGDNGSAEPAAGASTAAQPAAGGEVPSYPNATTQASGSGSNMGTTASGSVMSTDDSFDKVYAWYQQHMPAGSEKSHVTTPVQSAVFMIGDPSSGQKSVTITVQGSKTMITIADVKT